MTEKKKYGLLTLGWLALLVYLLATEVADRWVEAWDEYSALRAKEQRVLSPEDAAARKLELLEQRRVLEATLSASTGYAEQSQAGVVQAIDASAIAAGIQVDALVPHSAKNEGMSQEIALSLDVSGYYHKIGVFLNRLESSPIPMKITKVTIEKAASTRFPLKAKIDAVATISSLKQSL